MGAAVCEMCYHTKLPYGVIISKFPSRGFVCKHKRYQYQINVQVNATRDGVLSYRTARCQVIANNKFCQSCYRLKTICTNIVNFSLTLSLCCSSSLW